MLVNSTENSAEIAVSSEAHLQDHFARTQILLASFLPQPRSTIPETKSDKTSSLFYAGLPTVEQQQFQSAVDLVRPSPRFGLLLVGSVAV